MEIKHLVLETDSALKLQALLDSNAKNGFKAISLSTYFESISGYVYYTALMVKSDNL